MKKNSVSPYLSHQDISLLLPWYVNQSLGGLELKMVENHLKSCTACKREVATLQKLSLAVNRADTLESAAQASYARLKTRIHQTESSASHKSPASVRAFKWHQKLFRNCFHPIQPSVAIIAVLLLAMLLPVYHVANRMQQSDYRTLSSSDKAHSENDAIMVIFADGADRRHIDRILEKLPARIVDGPTPEGVYLIRLSRKPEARNVLDIITSLRKDRFVVFAEPADALLSSSQGVGATSK